MGLAFQVEGARDKGLGGGGFAAASGGFGFG